MKNSASNGKAHRKIDGKQLAHSIGEAASAAADNVGKTAVSVAGKTKELASKSQEAVYGALYQNGDGEVNIEDVSLPSPVIERLFTKVSLLNKVLCFFKGFKALEG